VFWYGILVLVLCCGFAYFFRDYFYSHRVGARKKGSPLTLDQRKFLGQYSFYYNQLPPRDREEFEVRLLMFVYNKKWQAGRDMPTITENQKIAIASYAAQITFGLKFNVLQKFKTIVLYYDQYTSLYTGKKHKGEVNMHGAIVLSWKYFEEGAKNHTDGQNLALHELAHAFFINNFSTKTFERNSIPRKYFDQMYQMSLQITPRLKEGNIKSLRAYASTNFQEFFACVMETFFEKPFDLKKELPDLYQCMCNMLRQDPAILYSNNIKK
jgi:MtfA peptidase